MGQWPFRVHFVLERLSICQLGITVTKSRFNYSTNKTKDRKSSVDTDFNVFSIRHQLPPIIVFIMIWISWLPFWLIDTWPWGAAKPSTIIALFPLIQLKFIYLAKWFIAPAIHLVINSIHMRLLTILPWYISKSIPRSTDIKNLAKLIHAFCPTFSWFLYSS